MPPIILEEHNDDDATDDEEPEEDDMTTQSSPQHSIVATQQSTFDVPMGRVISKPAVSVFICIESRKFMQQVRLGNNALEKHREKLFSYNKFVGNSQD